MSAAIRVDIIGGIDISVAHYDCQLVSHRLGGIAVETSFNGVEMLFHGQSREQWIEEYHKRVFGSSQEGGAK